MFQVSIKTNFLKNKKTIFFWINVRNFEAILVLSKINYFRDIPWDNIFNLGVLLLLNILSFKSIIHLHEKLFCQFCQCTIRKIG